MSVPRTRSRRTGGHHGPVGQVLVIFTLFLLVLLGISALAVDYVSWLLTDRWLQNVADHVALAGAGEFDERTTQGSCSGIGSQKCIDARAQMWTAVSEEMDLGLSPAAIGLLALTDSPPEGTTSVTAGGTTFSWGDRIWVSTPPPIYNAYTGVGGRYPLNWGITFARIDRDVRSFLGGALGIQPEPRNGWATAGALPTDFALEVFCRNNIAPQSGVCVNSAGLTVDGQGGIRLLRGDIGSNESLTVTSNVGSGVIVESGNMFLVNRECSPSTWNCAQVPATTGGISDSDPVTDPGANNKSAFRMPPIPLPKFASPLDSSGTGLTDTTTRAYNCAGASAASLCVPYKDQTSSSPTAPGDWTCSTSSSSPARCGLPTIVSGSVTCVGTGGGTAGNLYYPVAVSSGAPDFTGDAGHPQSNGNEFNNMDETSGPDTTNPPGTSPTDFVTTENLNITGSGTRTVTETLIVNLGQSGPRLPGQSFVRYNVFKTNGQAIDTTILTYDVTVRVRLLPASGTTAIATDTVKTLTNTPTWYEFSVGAGQIPADQFNSLRLEFQFSQTGVNLDAMERGGGVAWAAIEHPDPAPAVPPFIPPGYYRSIVIPNDACAILDPTGEYSSLMNYQMPGIYRFGGSGSPSSRKIKIGDGSFLIGDGVTLVFDADWPDSGSNQGLAIGANGALVLNTMRVNGTTPPCTPSQTETADVNMSAPLSLLPSSAVCAAWAIDHSVTVGVKPGQNAWDYCDTSNPDSGAHCTERDQYDPPAGYRGVTFYFTPDPGWSTAHGSMNIRNRFEMQGGSGNEAGIAFRGVMYAPYDDVKITGGNGFNTVGQVLAWTAKFNGGSAYINLDYPYDYTPAAPYLLEPTVGQ